MSTLASSTIAVHAAGKDDQVKQVSEQQKELDAGALFVLKSKGIIFLVLPIQIINHSHCFARK